MALGWAIVGPGRFAGEHIAPALLKAHGCRLVAVVSRARQRDDPVQIYRPLHRVRGRGPAGRAQTDGGLPLVKSREKPAFEGDPPGD